MKNIFGKFSGKSSQGAPSGIEKREFIYVLIQLPISNEMGEEGKGPQIIPRLFHIIEKTNGDINQYIGDTLLIFYGVPVGNPHLFIDFKSLLNELAEIGDKLHVIAGLDVGLYGPFGYEKRFIVTGLSHKLIEDFHTLNNLPTGKIHIQRNLWEKLVGFQMRENVVVLKNAD